MCVYSLIHSNTYVNLEQDYRHLNESKFPDISMMICQNSRIITSTDTQSETISDATAENSSCSKHCETKAMICIVRIIVCT